MSLFKQDSSEVNTQVRRQMITQMAQTEIVESGQLDEPVAWIANTEGSQDGLAIAMQYVQSQEEFEMKLAAWKARDPSQTLTNLLYHIMHNSKTNFHSFAAQPPNNDNQIALIVAATFAHINNDSHAQVMADHAATAMQEIYMQSILDASGSRNPFS